MVKHLCLWINCTKSDKNGIGFENLLFYGTPTKFVCDILRMFRTSKGLLNVTTRTNNSSNLKTVFDAFSALVVQQNQPKNKINILPKLK